MCVEHHIHTKGVTIQDPDRWCSCTPVGRNFGRSSANGCGISGWNSASTSLPQPCQGLRPQVVLLIYTETDGVKKGPPHALKTPRGKDIQPYHADSPPFFLIRLPVDSIAFHRSTLAPSHLEKWT